MVNFIKLVTSFTSFSGLFVSVDPINWDNCSSVSARKMIKYSSLYLLDFFIRFHFFWHPKVPDEFFILNISCKVITIILLLTVVFVLSMFLMPTFHVFVIRFSDVMVKKKHWIRGHFSSPTTSSCLFFLLSMTSVDNGQTANHGPHFVSQTWKDIN